MSIIVKLTYVTIAKLNSYNCDDATRKSRTLSKLWNNVIGIYKFITLFISLTPFSKMLNCCFYYVLYYTLCWKKYRLINRSIGWLIDSWIDWLTCFEWLCVCACMRVRARACECVYVWERERACSCVCVSGCMWNGSIGNCLYVIQNVCSISPIRTRTLSWRCIKTVV